MATMYYGEEGLFGLIEVAEVGDWDYSWHTTAVFYDKTHKAMRVSWDSGCSCYWPWESHYSIDDFGPPMGMGEAIKEFRKEAGDMYSNNSHDEIEKAVQEIREFAREHEVRR